MNAAILLSEFLTVALLGMCVAVIILWMPGNLQREESVKSHPSVRWLVAGIVTSFAASIIDNAWWGIAWGARYLGDPSWQWWFDNGVYSNIVSRQGLKLLAGWCHVKAAIEGGIVSERVVRDFLIFITAAGLIVACLLCCHKA